MKNIRESALLVIFITFYNSSYADSMGNLAQYPPSIKDLTISTNVEGMPVINPKEINLNTGNYYRLNIHIFALSLHMGILLF